MDHHISDHRHTTHSILGGLVGLLAGGMNNEPDKRLKKKRGKKERGCQGRAVKRILIEPTIFCEKGKV